jgi:hypothetical protein
MEILEHDVLSEFQNQAGRVDAHSGEASRDEVHD